MKTYKSDTIIVGAGAAGLMAALSLAPRPVTVLSEKALGGICASCWAQGGIAAAVGRNDTPGAHQKDTLKAGAGTTDKTVADCLTAEAPEYIRILEDLGVEFDRDEDGGFRLSREACHGKRRVLKALAGDGFGFELMRALTEAVKNTPSITFVEKVTAERILRENGMTSGSIQGILARNLETDEPILFQAPAVMLATGGIGGLYAMTTNPLNATGRGIAMAARAGAVLSDLEFVQFHPTAIDVGKDPAPLATEALRGEGAILVNDNGERFMEDIHEMAELAPRDVVSRANFDQIQKGNKVYLDCRNIEAEKFPALMEAMADAGMNPKYDLVPVTPAEHYHMGGIATDINGRASILGLWACGEVGATGLHGANRLASNSLMEAIVMGGRAARDIVTHLDNRALRISKELTNVPVLPRSEWMNTCVQSLRKIMTDKLGVIRTEGEMKTALKEISEIEHMSEHMDSRIADMALVARMITISALRRRESRGGHARLDYPRASKEWQCRSFVTMKEIDLLTAEIMRLNTTDKQGVAA